MAYVAGSSADMAALLSALQAALTSNGWTLSGQVLHKGDSFQRVRVVGSTLEILGGTGVDGSNLLTGGNGANVCTLGQVTSTVITFPLAYSIHVLEDPDEVYLFAQWSVDRYSWMAFGISDVPGILGTGGWYGASRNGALPSTVGIRADSVTASGSYGQPALFWRTTIGVAESYVHHGLDGGGWSGSPSAHCQAVQPLIQRQPNAWNSNAILLPTTVLVDRGSYKVSIVADLKHCRQVRIDNYAPLDIVTIGADKWRIYPWYQKNSTERNGPPNSGDHTGTLGCAIRYDGP